MMLEVHKEETMSPPANSSNELTSLAYRVGALEKDLIEIRTQLNLKTTQRENDLRFQAIDDKVGQALEDIREIKENLKEMVARDEQEQKDIAGELKDIHANISKIQIASLVYIIGFFLTIVGLVVVALITHTFH